MVRVHCIFGQGQEPRPRGQVGTSGYHGPGQALCVYQEPRPQRTFPSEDPLGSFDENKLNKLIQGAL